MSYYMFIDDERHPPKGDWVVVRSVRDAINVITDQGFPQFISFDHDLGYQKPTGMEFAHWLIKEDLNHGWMEKVGFAFDVHSMNPVGARNIRLLLLNYIEETK